MNRFNLFESTRYFTALEFLEPENENIAQSASRVDQKKSDDIAIEEDSDDVDLQEFKSYLKKQQQKQQHESIPNEKNKSNQSTGGKESEQISTTIISQSSSSSSSSSDNYYSSLISNQINSLEHFSSL